MSRSPHRAVIAEIHTRSIRVALSPGQAKNHGLALQQTILDVMMVNEAPVQPSPLAGWLRLTVQTRKRAIEDWLHHLGPPPDPKCAPLFTPQEIEQATKSGFFIGDRIAGGDPLIDAVRVRALVEEDHLHRPALEKLLRNVFVDRFMVRPTLFRWVGLPTTDAIAMLLLHFAMVRRAGLAKTRKTFLRRAAQADDFWYENVLPYGHQEILMTEDDVSRHDLWLRDGPSGALELPSPLNRAELIARPSAPSPAELGRISRELPENIDIALRQTLLRYRCDD